MLKLQMLLGFTCRRCDEFFTSDMRTERMMAVALFGMTEDTCPLCYSTPEHRGGKPLPPPSAENSEDET